MKFSQPIVLLNPTIKYFAYLWLQLKESLAVLTALNTYLRYLFITIYVIVWVLLVCMSYNKRLLKCLNIRILHAVCSYKCIN